MRKMLFLDPIHRLQSAILEALSRSPGMSVQELHSQVQKFDVDVSLPNLYRVVGEMIDHHMLVKNKGKLSLHSVWLAHLTSFVEQAKKTHAETTRILEVPLKPNECREFKADSLYALDPIWFQLLLDCAKLSQGKSCYVYNSHTWYTLGMHDQDERGWRGLTEHGTSCYFLCGNDTFLDRHGLKLLQMQNYHTAVTEDPPFPTDGYNINICGDYIIEGIFPEAIRKHFALFFESVKSIDQFDAELFADVFRMKAKCKITVRRNAEEAEKLRKSIKRYFK